MIPRGDLTQQVSVLGLTPMQHIALLVPEVIHPSISMMGTIVNIPGLLNTDSIAILVVCFLNVDFSTSAD